MNYLISSILALILCAFPINATTPQPSVEIYTIPSCPGCESAKSTLDSRNIPYTEISLYGRRDLYRQMKERVNAALPASERRPLEDSMTVPKIFIDGEYVPYSQLDEYLDKSLAKNYAKPING
jgi:glutaredoxin